MKRVFTLCLVLFAFFALKAQDVVLYEDFSRITDSNATQSIYQNLDNYTLVQGWTGDRVYRNNGKIKLGTGSKRGWLQTPALDLSNNGGQFTLSFDASRWSGDKTKLNVYVDETLYVVEGVTVNPEMTTFTLELTGGTAQTKIKFESFDTSKARLFLDNIMVVSQSFGPDTMAPTVLGVTPSENSVVLRFNEVLDPATAQNASNYVLDNNVTVTSATLNNRQVTLAVTPALTESTTYTLLVSNVADTAGNAMTSQTVTFTYGVSPEFFCANIAELKTKCDISDHSGNFPSSIEYKLTSEVVVTAVAKYNNQKVLQDETGAILVYDPDSTLGSLIVGDKVKDIYGTLTNYWGFLEFVPTKPHGGVISMLNDVAPLTITLNQLNDESFMVQHQAELIKLNGVTFTEQGQFAVWNTYEISQNGTTAKAVYPYFQDAATIGQNIPTGMVNIVGFNFSTNKIGSAYLDYRYYIVPRTMNDFTTGINNYISENDVVISPNPAIDYMNVTVENDNFKVSKFYVVDITGKIVSTQNVQENNFRINVSNLTSGCYFLRMTDGKHNVTTKFIKK